jgi:uncharacterized Zn-binding protein involved in type VI secretion
MGQSVARVGDPVLCSCSKHGPGKTGTIAQGVADIFANGLQISLVNHEGDLSCGHRFKITSGSSVYDVDGIPVARVGDSIVIISPDAFGSGAITGGSPTVFTD